MGAICSSSTSVSPLPSSLPGHVSTSASGPVVRVESITTGSVKGKLHEGSPHLMRRHSVLDALNTLLKGTPTPSPSASPLPPPPLPAPLELVDSNGYLPGCQFSIDPTRCDPDNDSHWEDYLSRQRTFEKELRRLQVRVPKRGICKLYEGITYIRPFLSSTFKDFNEERNHCFASSFPRVEKLCNDRGVFFAPLDLRWGVTSEQSESGHVIKICLEEIDRCRPYFIGSIGFRNGWMLSEPCAAEKMKSIHKWNGIGSVDSTHHRGSQPSNSSLNNLNSTHNHTSNPSEQKSDDEASASDSLLSKTFDMALPHFPWLGQHFEKSVTELEILHGALNDPSLSPRTFFYFRSVEFLRKLPKEKRRLYVEMGPAELSLQSLKLRIALSGFSIKWFDTSLQMAERLEDDLKTTIETDFPLLKLSALDRELKDHMAFGEMRTRVYTGGEEYIAKLDAYLAGDSSCPFIISGPSGAGKSSLVANWMKRVKERWKSQGFSGKKREDVVIPGASVPGAGTASEILRASGRGSFVSAPPPSSSTSSEMLHWNLSFLQVRYIGSTSDSTQPSSLIRWILQEIKSQYEWVDLTIPQDNKKVLECLSEWLDMICTPLTPLLIVLDGLDQLVGDNNSNDDISSLQWIPTTFPSSCRIVMSVSDESEVHKILMERMEQIPRGTKGSPAGGYVRVGAGGPRGSEVKDSLTNTLALKGFGAPPSSTPSATSSPLPSPRALDTTSVSSPPHISITPPPPSPIPPTSTVAPPSPTSSSSSYPLHLRVEPLSDSTTLSLIRMFLSSYGKHLDGLQENRIMSCVRTRNPLYLITFLQEVRTWGDYENLNQRIDHYMESKNIIEMFLKVLSRLENDFNRVVPKLVETTLSCMRIARRGLNEVELKGCVEIALGVSAKTSSFPSMEFSSLMLRLDQHFIDQRGLKQFSHAYLKEAIKEKYLKTQLEEVRIHGILAEYFSLIHLCERKAEEWPWHLFMILNIYRGGDGNLTEAASGGGGGGGGGGRRNSQPNILPMPADAAPAESNPVNTVISISTTAAAAASATAAATAASVTVPPSSPTSTTSSGRQSQSSPLPIPAEHLNTLQHLLQACLLDLDLFDLLKGERKYDLHKYWLLLEYYSQTTDLPSRLYLTALHQYQKRLGASMAPLQFAEKCEDVGTFLISTDRYNGADIYLDEAIILREKTQGLTHPDVEILLSKKANLYYRQGRFDEALPLYEKSLKIVECNEGTHSVRSSVIRTSIAGLLKEQGKFEVAEPLYTQSLHDKIALLGPRHPVVAISMSNLADLHLRMFKPEKALPLYSEALVNMEMAKGRHHPQVATIVSSLASAYMQMKKYDEAIKLYERARKIKEDLYGENHISVAVVLNNLAATYHIQGNHEKAIKLYERSLKIRQQTHGMQSPLIVPTLNNIGLIYLDEGKYKISLQYLSSALTLMESAYGPYHIELVGTLNSMSKIHMEEKNYDTALIIYLRELRIMETTYGKEDEKIMQTLNNVGMVYQSMNMFDEALPYHLRELKIAINMNMTQIEHMQQTGGNAQTTTQTAGGAANGVGADLCPDFSLKCAEIYMILGVVYASLNRPQAALIAFLRCFIIRRDLVGWNDTGTAGAIEWVKDIKEAEDDDENGEDDNVDGEGNKESKLMKYLKSVKLIDIDDIDVDEELEKIEKEKKEEKDKD